jgi:hypothetical protein
VPQTETVPSAGLSARFAVVAVPFAGTAAVMVVLPLATETSAGLALPFAATT